MKNKGSLALHHVHSPAANVSSSRGLSKQKMLNGATTAAGTARNMYMPANAYTDHPLGATRTASSSPRVQSVARVSVHQQE